MGLRIHKAMGFGLSNLQSKDYRFVDSRLAPDGFLMVGYEDREEFTLPGHVEWLRNKILGTPEDRNPDLAGQSLLDRCKFELLMLEQATVLPSVDECVVEAVEFGLPDTVLIVPPLYVKDWTRYSDDIDYYVECVRDDAGPARIDRPKYGIFPYEGCFMDRRDGRRLKSDANLFKLEPRNHHYQWDEIAKCLGFADEQEARANVAVAVPDCVLLLCEYLRLFKDPDTARYLEPMVYTYWA